MNIMKEAKEDVHSPVRVLQEFPKFHRSVTFHRALAARTADTHPQSAVTHIARSFPLA